MHGKKKHEHDKRPKREYILGEGSWACIFKFVAAVVHVGHGVWDAVGVMWSSVRPIHHVRAQRSAFIDLGPCT
jgi:hypothetical protein